MSDGDERDQNELDRRELERLRDLVGPSEVAYAALIRDRDEARDVARSALAETGVLRGRILELGVQVSRARQDQDLLQRQAAMSPTRRLLDRVRHRLARSVGPRVKRLVGKVR